MTTYTDEDLDAAVAAGALDAEAARALRAHVESARRLPPADEEHFRLVTGFNDVFVVVAGGLLLVALAWIGAAWRPWFGTLLAAAAAWGLAEFFVRRRRMALPAIVLLLAFVGAVFGTVLLATSKSTGGVVGAAAVAALAAWLHWLRFHVPITVAAGAGASAAATIAFWLALAPHSTDPSWLLFVCGLLVFGWALRWDASDRERRTRRADVAFWLHLLAAPMLVHPVFTALGASGGRFDPAADGSVDAWRAAAVLALYLGIALVSLWIDRRALMVSALGYVLYAFNALLQQHGFVSLGFAITAGVVGCALLVLSAFWQRSRAATLAWLPAPWRRYVPAMR
jgi:hypothetical protein